MLPERFSGLGSPATGRLAFRYAVTNTSPHGNGIGIGTASYDSASPVPEPASLLLFGTGPVGLRAWRKRRQ